MNVINERCEVKNEGTTPSASPRRDGSPPPHCSIIKPCGKGASTFAEEGTSPDMKKLLEAWLTNTLTSVLNKPALGTTSETTRTCTIQQTNEQCNQPLPSTTCITHNVIDIAGENALAAIPKRMEEMKNENKALRDQMKEHQEQVDKILGAPKLLLKRDAGRFVEQSYSDDVAPHAISKTFKMPPYLSIYDGTIDPEDNVTHYVIAVKDNDLAKEQVSSILLKIFGETLTGEALTWYSQLPTHSIETFEEMADKFVIAHAEAKKADERVNDIFTVRKSLGEGLRDFLARFNQVRMTLPNVSEGMAVATFQNRLSRDGLRTTRKLLSQLMKYPPATWDEIHNTYCAEVRANKKNLNELTHRLASVQAESRKDRRDSARRDHPIPLPNRERH
ncbi:uncharacterized protein [Nicotiana tomentosiformis]|uniref:uncharacterized protein n=1 Tax=Nicotiana tomentosiformis TaxID=4098 RepID=UPI000878D136|nr:uncharacterized protein LOC108943622 [Nicotiana tomentosiformis]